MKKNVIKRPILTEKTLMLVEEKNQYTFEVSFDANKSEVKNSVEKKFDVSVEGVRIANVIGKRVEWGAKRIPGSKSGYKKAIVQLKSSDSIDVFKVK